MPAKLLGAHMPGSGGLPAAIRKGKEIGCAAVQVFTSSPQQWKAKEVTPEMAREFKAAVAETGIRSLVSHDSYLVNLCSPDLDARTRSIDALVGEMVRCDLYGIPLVVSHMGAHMGQGEEAGLRIVADSALSVLAQAPRSVTLLMETTAGQGSALNYSFEQLAWLIDALGGHPNVGVCLDTCHIFVAGYDIRVRRGYEGTFEEFGRLIGLDRLKAVHCNDSKKGMATRVDRHEHIGKGEIGLEAFRMLVNDPRFENVPILLETPEAETMHAENLRTLKGLIE